MNSFVVDREAVNGNRITIEEATDVNHIKNVLRLKCGDEIRVVDGEYEYFCRIAEIEKKYVVSEYYERKSDMYSLNTNISAAIGIIKNDKMDLVIQKLTEIGISKIIPLITKRSVVKIEEKKDKWQKITNEAQKQCRGVKGLEILNPQKLSEIDWKSYDLIFVPYEKEDNKSIWSALENKKGKNILFIIGPEGGFDESEIDLLIKNGAEIVTLGKRILRAETAAIVTGGILANVLG